MNRYTSPLPYHWPTTPQEAQQPRGYEYSLAELRGDCVRMAPHWAVPAEPLPAPVPPSRIRGVTVPAAADRLIDAMSEYGG
ncbi:hypothetical protein [Streptomyces yaizuensis]|uniref:Uncharacterized protein n=1 Tax=Streptomyces yaizuensis TaxID=2989713 RepID=A0ABQ5NUR4_9ACTN|nr:hypothetical protein [Streptomyces sp. YSPA8]GLF94109.1 hypothetical protein SYYSPA8_07450 [Streptomyces sp. YSPA8]